MRIPSISAASTLMLLAAVVCSAVPASAQKAVAAVTDKGAATEDSGAGDYEKLLKDADRKDGIFPVIVKAGKVYLELTADQLDKDFYEHATTANGLGGFGIYSGDSFQQDARIVRFHRVDDKHVAVVWPHEIFVAQPGTSLETAVRNSTADSVEAVAAIAAEDKKSKKIAIDTAFLLGDELDLGNLLSQAVENPRNPQGGYHLDPARTYYGPVKAFPKNDLIEVEQTFESGKPDTIDTVTDPRSIQMRVKYNFAEVMSSPDYMPRYGDDRVGYFTAGHITFDRDREFDNRLRYLTRWNIKASDPTKPSPAVKPIVFTLTNTIPEQYRAPIKEAILEWNKAFAQIGILDAVQVQDQPADPAWDADDIRYNTIRWLTEANGGGFAEAQLEWDPRTGEVFRGGVLIDSDIVRYGNNDYDLFVKPTTAYDPDPAASLAAAEIAGDPDLWDPAKLVARDVAVAARRAQRAPGFFHRDEQAHEQFAFGALALQLQGQPVDDAFRYQFLKSIVLHEVGHDFGLQHNFIGHNSLTSAEVRDAAFTHAHGVGSSVMEYAPTNLWPKGRSHGEYFATTLGTYDYYAIHWGYAPVPGATTPAAETATLSKWASHSTDPRFAFASDEDVEYDGHAVDPRIAQYMLTDKPLEWCESQLDLDRSFARTLDARFPAPQAPWDDARLALIRTTGNYMTCAGAMTHYIAGEHLSRARRGDVGATNPLTPVTRAEERRAYGDLDKYLFADNALPLSPTTLSRSVYSEYSSFSLFGATNYAPRHDVSYAQMIAAYQNRALAYMFSPLVLARLADLPTKASPGTTMSLADLFTWTQGSIYGDLAKNDLPKTQVRRNLQRRYAQLLSYLTLRPLPGTPLDAQALARFELTSLAGDIKRNLMRPNLDTQSRAHLEAMQVDVMRALDPHTMLVGA